MVSLTEEQPASRKALAQGEKNMSKLTFGRDLGEPTEFPTDGTCGSKFFWNHGGLETPGTGFGLCLEQCERTGEVSWTSHIHSSVGLM